MSYQKKTNPFWQSAGGAAAISGISGASTGLLGALFAGQSQTRQYNYNVKLQDDQQNWQKYMWDLENIYNLPKNEVQRLLDAGINPALAFGNAGGAAAPVPMSGSSGGVSAPMPDFPNFGAAAVNAANVASLNSSQVELNTALAEKARKEGDAAVAATRESNTRSNLNDFTLGMNTELRPVLVGLPRMDFAIRKMDQSLMSNRVIRDNWDTAYHLSDIQLRQESMRRSNALTSVQIRHTMRDVDRIGALISLYASQKRLTEEQANMVACRVYSSIGQAYIGKLRYNALHRASNSTYTVDGKPISFSDALFEQISSEFAAQLDRSRANALNAGLDLAFQRQYGAESRDYDFNLKKQQFYINRSNLWLGAEKFILDAVGTFIKPGSPLYRDFRETSSQFDFDLPPLDNYDRYYQGF